MQSLVGSWAAADPQAAAAHKQNQLSDGQEKNQVATALLAIGAAPIRRLPQLGCSIIFGDTQDSLTIQIARPMG